jgi:hypothetical protein
VRPEPPMSVNWQYCAMSLFFPVKIVGTILQEGAGG